MAGTASIFRIDSNGDTEASARTANQIIEFNGTGLNPDDRSNVTSFRANYLEDISMHPNPNRHLTQIQDGKLGTVEFEIQGVFTMPISSAGAIARFHNWMKADKTNSSLPYGRFGIRYDNMSQFDLTPSSTIGLILYQFEVFDVDEFQGKASFVARLYRNGSI